MNSIRSNINELHNGLGDFWGKIQYEAAEKGIPIHGHFELTPLCNLKCKMCYVQLENSKQINKKMLTFLEWKKIIDEACEMGMIFASLTGGECLTNPLFKDIYLYLKSKGIMIFVLTNGVLLDKWVEFFVNYPPKLIQVSVYGKDEESYERVTQFKVYEKVKRNIELAIKNNISICINITPNKYLTDIYPIVKYYKDKNISVSLNQYLMNPKKNTGRSLSDFNLDIKSKIDVATQFYKAIYNKKPLPKEDLETFLSKKEIHKNLSSYGLQCAAGRSDFAIGWDGTMYMCVALEIPTGTPLVDGFKVSWEKTNKKALSLNIPRKCLNCKLNEVCNLCPGQHYYDNESIKLNNNVCEETLKNVEQGIEYL